MSNGFVVTSLLILFIFVFTAAAGDGHSPQVAAVHAVLSHWSHRDQVLMFQRTVSMAVLPHRVLFSAVLQCWFMILV